MTPKSAPKYREPKETVGTVAELFAGVGGFRIALARSGWSTIFSNQWEPSTKIQHASDVYVKNFGPDGHSNEDIATVLDRASKNRTVMPSFDLLVGGFPCQDYSVAKLLSSSKGIAGKKGVLWWEIIRLIDLKKPKMVCLENVDRLLKSPASQRGRDFGIMLASLTDRGYAVEWRVVNAADYGFPQRRRRVFIVAKKARYFGIGHEFASEETLRRAGVMARAFPVASLGPARSVELEGDLAELTQQFGTKQGLSPFANAGAAVGRKVITSEVKPKAKPKAPLRDIVEPDNLVPQQYWIESEALPAWQYLKGPKREERLHRASGSTYTYSEGGMRFPDSLSEPARTILTGEGGTSPSRFKHVVYGKNRRLRRLLPVELERLNGFPDGFTQYGRDLGMISDTKRAFFMGNALVVGVVERIGKVLAKDFVDIKSKK